MTTSDHDVDPSITHAAERDARARPGPARSVWLVWVAGGAVAAGAAVATAHGLYETAIGARVPAGIAWLYPLITDGLALVAYAATSRLTGTAARYAWAVVVLAAGLSGLAQAAYLAADPTTLGGAGGSGALLRFGVGAWPAIAAAITAHLLYLLAAATSTPRPLPDRAGTPLVDTSASTPGQVGAVGRPALPAAGEHGARAGVLARTAETPARARPAPGHASVHARVPAAECAVPAGPDSPPGRTTVAVPESRATPLRERATAVAEAFRAEHGAWPSVRALAAAADVSEGLAAKTLRHLRTSTDTPTSTSTATSSATTTTETTP